MKYNKSGWGKGTFSKRTLSQRTLSKDPLAKGHPKSKDLWLLRYLTHTQQGKHRLGQVVRWSEGLLRYLAHTQQGKYRLGQVVRLSEVFTIHKLDICSRQKYPKLLNNLSNSVFHAGHKYAILFEIEATFRDLFLFFFFFKNFILKFFVYFQLFNFMSQISGNHATSTCDVFIFEFSKFCCFDHGERQFVE